MHIATDGIFVTTTIKNSSAEVNTQVVLLNESQASKTVDVVQTVVNAAGKSIASNTIKQITVFPYQQKEVVVAIPVPNPSLWSLDDPYLYKLITTVMDGGKTIDQYETSFGIRTFRFDANKGFFLNGKNIKIHGTNNHQDHAGVGVAMPDALQEYRIKKLKEFGCNAYRCSHHPPTPELLDACDRLGMLVIDENRLMGVSSTHYNYMQRFMLRDRNHPSIISWSIGNEEWGIEGNDLGASIATSMQTYAKSIDTTRAITAAISGGWQKGISNVIDVMGVNYIGQINTDEHHAEFPNQPMWGTEEGSTRATRGIYVDDPVRHYLAAYDRKPNPSFYSIEDSWKYYVARDYLAGMLIWTGFDYRGEPSPFGYPSTGSLFGMMDQCGFPKDNVYYLKSWWTDQTTLHILPHWNWKGKEGTEISVLTYSNCEEVELLLNKKSLGKQVMPRNGHLEWKVKYQPGILEAIGYKNGKKIATDQVQTTDEPASIKLTANQSSIKADQEDIAVIALEVNDKNGLHVPTADTEISFTLTGPGKIIGVGNGNPTSLEADKYLEKIQTVALENLKEKIVTSFDNPAEIAPDYDDSRWNAAFKDERTEAFGQSAKAIIYRCNFDLPNIKETQITLFYKPIGQQQSIYINGKLIAADVKETASNTAFTIDKSMLHSGKNNLTIEVVPLLKKRQWDVINMDPGTIQIITAAPVWKRKLFNGYAQIIVQSTGKPGAITVTATAAGLKPTVLKIESAAAPQRAAMPGNY